MNKKYKVGDIITLEDGGDRYMTYMIDRLDDTVGEIRNICNGRTKIVTGDEYEKLFRTK